MDCRRTAGSPNDKVRCWTCNQDGHIAATCHTLRCYTCSGFGHKSQECASQRNQLRRIPSYTSARRTNEPWRKSNAQILEDKNIKAYSQGHSQVWRNEVDQISVGNSNTSVRRWMCNHVSHITAYCCTMRC